MYKDTTSKILAYIPAPQHSRYAVQRERTRCDGTMPLVPSSKPVAHSHLMEVETTLTHVRVLL